MKSKRILILAPHTDDGEFGCGGSIVRFISEGADVYYAAFSLAEESVPRGFPKNILKTEVKKATSVIGIRRENLLLYKYKVRYFASNRQEILEDLVRLKRELDPDLVFMPTLQDLHQDHSTIANEGLRAFKQCTILCYEMPWNNLNFYTHCFVRLGITEIDKKVEALSCYESQKNRYYSSAEFIKSLAVTRGTQVGTGLAEAFQVGRWII
ncbi:MAG: PIG-L family deacetylase [Deltaproteobacteria bacterium]|nr:PIG-L family deacetylase [Deltaproteobacteria bacterium]